MHKGHAVLELLQALLQLGGLLGLGLALLGLDLPQTPQPPLVEVVTHVGADLVQSRQDVDKCYNTDRQTP